MCMYRAVCVCRDFVAVYCEHIFKPAIVFCYIIIVIYVPTACCNIYS